ncbi:extracellular solute-binding protein [Roseomonas sp. KE2513]|uniref:ABC transporter substrate-binding protein n=1 Tax=Roseomonas sp. KE2513 TaxID=2479202 RepID=UPI0018E05A4E|nr:extracellular solute-binding protein [Roseomonas sp. KE2513]MBI0538601.1 extracellular solute-binding protein [Roseomonas sp. KE2513]
MSRSSFGWLRAGAAALGLFAAAPAAMAQPTAASPQTVTMWSHWPDEASKRNYVEGRVRAFEASNPQCRIRLSFIQKADIYTSARAAVRTGQAPDIFWLEPDEIAFARNGFLEPLDKYVDLNGLEDWARTSWSHNGRVYGLPLEAYTVELYYNRDRVRALGVEVPASGQLNQAQFTDLVRRGVAAGITPLAQGVADRPFPGAYFLEEVLLRRLGPDDYRKLLTGHLPFRDPRVMAAMTWVRELVDIGAYPRSMATLKLGESHYYFHTNPGALMFPIASWYTGRAFVPPESGGQPPGFPLGLMQYPVMDNSDCPECKTLAVGGSYVMYSRSRNKECAGALLNSFVNIESGNQWMESVLLQTGIRTDPSRISGINAPYFRELQQRSEGARFFIGTPLQYMTGRCADTFQQVLNRALPGGQISPQDAAAQMDAACAAAPQ